MQRGEVDGASAKREDCPGTVLVVDDESDVRLVLGKQLEAAGYQVDTAADGEEAREKLRSYVPDIVLLDVMMPKISGLELCRVIRSEGRLRHTCVIMVTARGGINDQMAGLDAGADDYIVKPFGISDLLLRMQSAERPAGPAFEMKDNAFRDELTGLHGKNVFWAELQAELKRSSRLGHSTCLILISVEGLAEVSDDVSANAARAVLKTVAQAIRDSKRTNDTAARVRGDRFAVMLPRTDLETAQRVASAVEREALAAVVVFEGTQLPVSLTVGVVVSDGHQPESAQALFARAGAALRKSAVPGAP